MQDWLVGTRAQFLGILGEGEDERRGTTLSQTLKRKVDGKAREVLLYKTDVPRQRRVSHTLQETRKYLFPRQHVFKSNVAFGHGKAVVGIKKLDSGRSLKFAV